MDKRKKMSDKSVATDLVLQNAIAIVVELNDKMQEQSFWSYLYIEYAGSEHLCIKWNDFVLWDMEDNNGVAEGDISHGWYQKNSIRRYVLEQLSDLRDVISIGLGLAED